MNDDANLQGARYGLFYFTVLSVEDAPAGLPESGSTSSLNVLRIRVDPPPPDINEDGEVTIDDGDPNTPSGDWIPIAVMTAQVS